MLLAVPALSPQFRKHSGEKTPLEKAVTFLRMPSQTPIHTWKGAFGPTKKGGGGVHPPHPLTILPDHSSSHLPNKSVNIIMG